MAWEMRTSAEANSSDPYRPKTVEEQAGARGGVSAAVTTDPNYVFARTRKVGLEKTPYPIGVVTLDDITQTDILTPVEVNATLTVPNV
jgi:hypothetical protein